MIKLKIIGLVNIVKEVANHPLHRKQKIKSVVRWVRLTLAIWMTPTKQIAIPYVGGAILNWPIESSSVMICARYGLGEYTDMVFLLHLLRDEDLFCDVGANAGVYTVLAGRAVGCHVVAAEPVPKTFDLLMQNVYANNIAAKVDGRNIGIGSEVSRLHFTSSLWSYNHVVETASENTVEVDVFALDDVLNGRVPIAIKIDVEGFEAQVVAGVKKTLSHLSLQAVISEIWEGHLARYEDTLDQVLIPLKEAGLHGPFWYDPEQRKLVPSGHPEKRKFNQIFVRDLEFISNRIKTSISYEIHGTIV